MVTRTSRFRTELTDVAWAIEDAYGVMPPKHAMGTTTLRTMGTYTRQWGLVTGGITLPNPRYEWQQFMGIGVDSRNMLFPIQGRQSMEGSVPNVLLCHDSSRFALEMGMGLMANRYNRAAGHATNAVTGTINIAHNNTGGGALDGGSSAGYGVTISNGITDPGATLLSGYKVTAAPASSIIIVAPYPGANLNVFKDSWAYIGGQEASTNRWKVFRDRALTEPGFNGKIPLGGGSTQYSINSVEKTAITTTGSSPTAATLGRYVDNSSVALNRVIVRENNTQPSFTVSARFRADDGSNFAASYIGNKVSRLTFNFAEGEPVTYSMDFIGKDMRHNIGEDDGSGSATMIKKFQASYTESDYGSSTAVADMVVMPAPMVETRVTEQPYFFSNARLKLKGTEFARFRNFTIAIDNGLDPRYYVGQSTEGSPDDNRQILSEILEGRRNITFSGSLDVDNAGANVEGANPVDAQLLQYTLNQGQDYLSGTNDVRQTGNALQGISIEISLERLIDGGGGGNAWDRMVIQLPNDGTSSATTPGLVMRSASMNIAGPPQIHQAMDIDGFASSIGIELFDNTAEA